MNRKLLVLALLIGGVWKISFAQINASGEFRSRSIVDHGFMQPVLKGSDANAYFDQRSRVKLDYQSQKFAVRFTLQDARIWGGDDIVSRSGAFGNSGSLGVYESWVNLWLTENSNIKIGRQEWNYDDMRILSFRDWLTSGQSYDGILYQLKNKKSTLDIGLSYNNNGERHGILNNSGWEPDKIKTMNFVRFKQALGEKTSLALITSLSGKVDTASHKTLLTGTHGIDLVHNYGPKSRDGFLMRLSAYYQNGSDVNRGSDGSYKNISAYLISLETGIRSLDKKLEVKVGAELISGRDYKNTDADYMNTRHSFDMQYGAILPNYGGYMNHFIVQDSYLRGTKGGGYIDPFVKASYRLSLKSRVEASVFSPYLTTAVRAHTAIDAKTAKPVGAEVDADGNPVFWKGKLGTYFDVRYAYQFSPEINLRTGFSYGMVSDIKNQMVYGYKNVSEKQLHEMGQNYFGWVMLTVKPNFIKNN